MKKKRNLSGPIRNQYSNAFNHCRYILQHLLVTFFFFFFYRFCCCCCFFPITYVGVFIPPFRHYSIIWLVYSLKPASCVINMQAKLKTIDMLAIWLATIAECFHASSNCRWMKARTWLEKFPLEFYSVFVISTGWCFNHTNRQVLQLYRSNW